MKAGGDVDLAACGLAPSVLAALLKAGFRYKADVVGMTARELANEAEISAADATRILELVVQQSARVTGRGLQLITAFELLKENERLTPISTLLPELDQILGGGFQRGEVTELCGAPGSGKTQIGLQMCIAGQCQFSANKESRSSVVYIDTEGSFVVDRVAAIADATIERRPDIKACGVDRDDLLKGIVYFRAHDFVEQMEVLTALPDLLQSRPDIQLIIVDSVAFHFRHGFEEVGQRSRALDNIIALLHHLAVKHGAAVTVTNQITSRSGTALRGGMADIPTLGENWSHGITNRLSLLWEGEKRIAKMTKSSSLAHGSVRFQRESTTRWTNYWQRHLLALRRVLLLCLSQ